MGPVKGLSLCQSLARIWLATKTETTCRGQSGARPRLLPPPPPVASQPYPSSDHNALLFLPTPSQMSHTIQTIPRTSPVSRALFPFATSCPQLIPIYSQANNSSSSYPVVYVKCHCIIRCVSCQIIITLRTLQYVVFNEYYYFEIHLETKHKRNELITDIPISTSKQGGIATVSLIWKFLLVNVHVLRCTSMCSIP